LSWTSTTGLEIATLWRRWALNLTVSKTAQNSVLSTG
jgi:hypothetical protein